MKGYATTPALAADPTLPEAALPTPLQLLLFRTALCRDEDLPGNWLALLPAPEGEPTDPLLVPHLALLHRRLSSQNTDSLATAVRTYYRQTWLANQVLFAALRTCLATLESAGVRTLLLKGAALLAAYYGDMGARSMGDFDILVPHAEFDRAVQALTAAGWTPVHPEEGFDSRFTHALAMIDARGNNLDLHSHVLHFTTAADADDLFWTAAIPIHTQKLHTLGLCGADLVLHLAVHGLRWSPQPQLRWIPDIACVLREQAIDWERLLWMSQHLHASIAVSGVLAYLQEQAFVQVPEPVLAALRSAAIAPHERERFELSTQDTFTSLRSTARFHWHIMTQGAAAGTLPQKLRLLPAYLAHRMKTREFGTWYNLLGAGILRHLLAKIGRYERSPTGHRLR